MERRAHRRSHRLHLHQRRAEFGTCDHREPGASWTIPLATRPCVRGSKQPRESVLCRNWVSSFAQESNAMREYKGSEIRNIAVVGHGASGKTSLVDALAFVSGSSKRHGSVKDGTALTDTAPEEIERGYSINLGLRVRRVAGHEDQPDRHARVSRLPGRRDRRTRRRRRRARASSPRRPASRRAPSACSARRSSAAIPCSSSSR